MKNEIANRYGQALFSLAEDSNKVSSLQEEVKVLRDILADNPDFMMVLDSDFLSIEERKEIVDKTLKNADKDLLALIKILIENRRIKYLNDVLQSFNSYCNDSFGIKEGLLYSTEPVDKKTVKEIEEQISKLESCKVELINKIDPSLIGGVKVVINDRVYDGTIKNRLAELRKSLLK